MTHAARVHTALSDSRRVTEEGLREVLDRRTDASFGVGVRNPAENIRKWPAMAAIRAMDRAIGILVEKEREVTLRLRAQRDKARGLAVEAMKLATSLRASKGKNEGLVRPKAGKVPKTHGLKKPPKTSEMVEWIGTVVSSVDWKLLPGEEPYRGYGERVIRSVDDPDAVVHLSIVNWRGKYHGVPGPNTRRNPAIKVWGEPIDKMIDKRRLTDYKEILVASFSAGKRHGVDWRDSVLSPWYGGAVERAIDGRNLVIGDVIFRKLYRMATWNHARVQHGIKKWEAKKNQHQAKVATGRPAQGASRKTKREPDKSERKPRGWVATVRRR